MDVGGWASRGSGAAAGPRGRVSVSVRAHFPLPLLPFPFPPLPWGLEEEEREGQLSLMCPFPHLLHVCARWLGQGSEHMPLLKLLHTSWVPLDGEEE
jgi:hypothetical protein